MTIATISAKGQITLPVAARKAAGMSTHDRVVVEVRDRTITIRPARDVTAFRGFLGKAASRRVERAAVMRHVSERQTRRS
jgi:AbrB family looped-hinge helix DNA binding protein